MAVACLSTTPACSDGAFSRERRRRDRARARARRAARSLALTDDRARARHSECDIRVQLSSISRRHAQLVFDENGAVLLENLSATNPAMLNGKPVPVEQGRVKVRNKDVLELGPRQFRIDLGNVPVSSTKKRKAFVPGDDDSTEELTNDVTAALRSTMLRTAPAPTSARKASERRSLPTPVRAAITAKASVEPQDDAAPRDEAVQDAAPTGARPTPRAGRADAAGHAVVRRRERAGGVI